MKELVVYSTPVVYFLNAPTPGEDVHQLVEPTRRSLQPTFSSSCLDCVVQPRCRWAEKFQSRRRWKQKKRSGLQLHNVCVRWTLRILSDDCRYESICIACFPFMYATLLMPGLAPSSCLAVSKMLPVSMAFVFSSGILRRVHLNKSLRQNNKKKAFW